MHAPSTRLDDIAKAEAYVAKGTGQTVKAIGEVDDLAYAMTMLASRRADYINGANFHVDGGDISGDWVRGLNPPRNGEVARSDGGGPSRRNAVLMVSWGPSTAKGRSPSPFRGGFGERKLPKISSPDSLERAMFRH
jgi:hypothetical protein